MESDVVGAEEAVQDLLADREDPVELRRRERDMQEETDRKVGATPPQSGGHQHQVEIVHPHPCARRAMLGDRVGEPVIHLDVALPG